MKNARTTKLVSALAGVFALAVALITPSEVQAAAGGIQNCVASTTCTIGEFLYDDSSVALTGATCTLTSKYPDGSAHLTSQSMTGQSDGWYSYEFTAPTTTGLYRATVSCTSSGDTISIDRSFQVNSASSDSSSIASAVWSYSGRTLSSFGDLIASIWDSSKRTLTGTGLSSGNLATQDDVVAIRNQITDLSDDSGDLTEIKKNTSETRLLMEEVVNKPIIENVLEYATPDLGAKIKDTKTSANQIFVNSQYLISQSATLTASWNKKSGKELLASVIELSNILGESGDGTDTDTVFGQVNKIKNSWDWDETGNLYNELNNSEKIIEELKVGLADYEKSPTLNASAKSLVKSLLAMEKVIGSVKDNSSKKTLFAKIKSVEALALALDKKSAEVDEVLGVYTKTKDVDSVLTKTKDLKNQVVALNKVPGVGGAIVSINPNKPVSVTNALLGLRGILNSNKKLLALGTGKTLVNTWLEVGSVVFKTVVTNPSKLIAQDVDIKYYLPQEIKKDDVMKTDDGIKVEYDSEKDQLFVAGTLKLAVGQTKTLSVETNDIWDYSIAELNSLREEANELYKPLEKTAYFAQGVSLKSDINANVDKMLAIREKAVTPEDKIRAYRECKIIKTAIDTKIAGMRELVSQASASGNLFGFVGGAQTIAVWGIIAVVIVGFVFMMIFMKSMTGVSVLKPAVVTQQAVKRPRTANLIAVMLVSSVLSASITGFIVSKVVTKSYEEKISVLGEKTKAVEKVEEVKPQSLEVNSDEDLGTGGTYLVVVGETPTGFLRVREAPNGKEVSKVYEGDKLPFLDENENWYQVETESGDTGWVSKTYSSKE